MAGIGWRLEKMMAGDSLAGTLGAFLTGVAVTSGPWLLTTLVLVIVRITAASSGTLAALKVEQVITVVYATVIVLSAPLDIVLSRYAADRVPVAIVSGAARAEIVPVIEAAGIAPLFTTLVTSDDVERGKPDPEGYVKALAELGGVSAGDVVAFEDTEAGVTSAKAAGMRVIARLGTLVPDRLAAAEELIDTIDVELVRRLIG